MKFDCPYCRKILNLPDLQLEADLSAVIALQVVFGRHQPLVWAYLELFQVRPLNMKVKKLRLLLEEMKRLFDSESFSYQKRAYAITQAGIAEALGIVAKKNFSAPLENHNYLKKIMISIAEAADKTAGIVAEKDLRSKEAQLMSGSRESNPPSSPFAKGGKAQGAPPFGKAQEEPPFGKGGQGGLYEIPEERLLPQSTHYVPKTMPPAHLTEEQITENKRRIHEIMKNMGG